LAILAILAAIGPHVPARPHETGTRDGSEPEPRRQTDKSERALVFGGRRRYGGGMAMRWDRLLSARRIGPVPARKLGDARREFEVDHDRIVFSRSFRRLQDKTQVHPMSENDHVRRRLTHSVEVASVGRSLGTTIGDRLVAAGRLEVDPRDLGMIVQAACLAHDIGNPPFGHSGEEAIRDWFCGDEASAWGVLEGIKEPQRTDLQTFEGNAHGFRVLSRLEAYREDGGMRLTAAVLGAFMKYPYGSEAPRAVRPHGKRKFGYFASESDAAAQLAEALGLLPHPQGGWCRHPLVYVVEAADDICYALADLEDGVELGVLPFERVESLLARFIPESSTYPRIDEPSRCLEMLRSYAVRRLVPQLADCFAEHEDRILRGELDAELLDVSPDGEVIREAQALARREVFSHPRKVYTEIGAFETIGGLLRTYVRAILDAELGRVPGRRIPARSRHLIDLMGSEAPGDAAERPEALRRVTDYVAGMTDGYAAKLYRRITGGHFD